MANPRDIVICDREDDGELHGESKHGAANSPRHHGGVGSYERHGTHSTHAWAQRGVSGSTVGAAGYDLGPSWASGLLARGGEDAPTERTTPVTRLVMEEMATAGKA